MIKFIFLVILLPVLSLGQTYIQGLNLIEVPSSIATSGGTTTLTAASQTVQQFTGTSIQSVVLPDATTLKNGRRFEFINDSTLSITIKYSDTTTALLMPGATRSTLRVISNGTAVGTWSIYGADSVDVSIGTANGLTITGQSLSLGTASTSTTGALTSTDWNTFNNKQPAGNYITALTGDVTATGPGSVAATLATVNGNVGSFGSSTSIPSITVNGKGLITAASGNAVIAPAGTLTGTTLNATVVNSSLTSLGTITTGVWQGSVIATTYGGTGVSALGNLTDAGTDGIVVTGGTGAVIVNASLAQHVADTTHNGYLSSTDWTTFNGKQPAGNYITALTGDGTASGPGSAAFTLATVNGNVGSFGTASSVGTFTVNAKGLVTAASNTAISLPTTQLTGTLQAAQFPALTGDVTTTAGSLATTLATVNATTGSFGSSTSIPSFTVNGKGLITAASGNVVIAPAGTLTGTTLNSTVVSSSLTSLGTITTGVWNGTTIDVAHGGTSLTTLTANNVILGNGTSAPNFVAPGTSGNILTSNGTTWVSSTPATSGTVTSVALTVPAFLSVTGSPVTSSGTLAVSLSGTALPVANGGTGQTTLTNHGVLIGAGTSGITQLAAATAGTILTGQGAADPSFLANVTLGVNGTTAGVLKLATSTASGGLVTIENNSTTSGNAYNFALPSTAGTVGYFLTSQAGSADMTWSSPPGFFKTTFTASGTFTTATFPSILTTTTVKITCVGAGGDGGGNGGGASSGGAGGGGGGGAAVVFTTGSALGVSKTVTIGAHGAPGGASSVGTLVSASGGGAGVSASAAAGGTAGGSGGVGTIGDVLTAGSTGGWGQNTIAAVVFGPGGNGGNAAGQYGGGGGQGANGNGGGAALASSAGGNYGGGGGAGSGSTQNGSNGANGICVFEWAG